MNENTPTDDAAQNGGPETSNLQPATPGQPATPEQPAPPPPRRLASFKELRAVFRAERETVFLVAVAEGVVELGVRWRPLSDAEKVPLQALLSMTVSPVRFDPVSGEPVAMLNDAAMALQQAKREGQRRALAAFYGVPELQREFGQKVPSPVELDDATIEELTAFVGAQMPQDLLLAIEQMVLAEAVDVAGLTRTF